MPLLSRSMRHHFSSHGLWPASGTLIHGSVAEMNPSVSTLETCHPLSYSGIGQAYLWRSPFAGYCTEALLILESYTSSSVTNSSVKPCGTGWEVRLKVNRANHTNPISLLAKTHHEVKPWE